MASLPDHAPDACKTILAIPILPTGRRQIMPRLPRQFPRRLLLAVTGLSPQIVTETLYALAVGRNEPFIPTEIRLITTREGAERARLSLLHPASGWFHRLRADYELPEITFKPSCIHVIGGADAEPLSDIRSAEDNIGAADTITEIVRNLTIDDDAALHVSIAGGRKTMGFYLGYALSLYGRRQDRLSHVLVNEPFESHSQFFYPTRESHIIHTPPPANRPCDTRDAVVTLADIPFVRLREGLPLRLVQGRTRFSEAVAAAQRVIGPVELALDLPGRRIRAGGEVVDNVPPVLLAFLAWMARRQSSGVEWVSCPSDGVPELDHAAGFLAEYAEIIGPLGDSERTVNRLRYGMENNFFSQTKSKLARYLRNGLGDRRAGPYLPTAKGRRPQRRFGLDIKPGAISFEPVRMEVDKAE